MQVILNLNLHLILMHFLKLNQGYQVVLQQISSLVGFGFMVINTTFINILVISCQSVLLVEETGVPGENHQTVASN